MGPAESKSKRTSGAWRLLVWAPLAMLAVGSRFLPSSSWSGAVALWGWAPLVAGVVAVWAVIGLLGYREWRRHTDRLEAIPIRIHVDGSRGKTGTCRLIGAALRANGLRVVVKTTGKMPVLIDVDGKETILERPPTPTANLREQKAIVRLAKEQHAQAIVIECMAVDPELRRVSQDTLIRATLAVITNIRRDHLEIIGPDLGTGARHLSDVIPKDGTVITAEQRLLGPLRDEAEKRHASLVVANPSVVSDALLESFPYITFKENVALALAVVESLGLDRERAVEGMLHSTPDYGTVQLFERRNHAGVYTFVCALGVNDVDSLVELQRELIRRKKLNGGPLVGLFNSRDDRAPRSVEFARAMTRELAFRSVIVTGRHTKAFVRAAVRNGYPRDQLSDMENATPREILEAVDARAPAGGAALACGNMVTSVGYGLVEALLGRGTDGHTGS
ncbi:MAG TPA: poly-gamma-glutamate synthase PgsB [Thermoplasmata archaeon]|nr:poly-gamma-glutamate synthase PgsB [Thermoplasmata archaeon]